MPMPPSTRGTSRRTRVHPETGLRDAPQSGDRALAVGRVLQLDLELLPRLGRVLGDVPAGDVALTLEDPRERLLQLRGRHQHLVVERGVRVPQTGEHVGDRVGHHERTNPLTTTPWSHRALRRRATIVRKQMRQRPKRLYTERARPQRRHRVYPRTLNFGVRCCFWTRAFFAISSLPLALLVAAEREPERAQECAALVVGGARGDDGDVHPTDGVDLVVVDLREDQLLGDAEGVVAPAVERPRVEPPEVADAGDRDARRAGRRTPTSGRRGA